MKILLWIKIKAKNGLCYATVTQINFGDEMKTAPRGSRQKYGNKKKETFVRRQKRAVFTEETEQITDFLLRRWAGGVGGEARLSPRLG